MRGDNRGEAVHGSSRDLPMQWTVRISPLWERRSAGAEFEHRRCEEGLTGSEGKTGEGARPPGYSSITPFVLKLRTSKTSRILELLSYRQSFSGVAQTVRSIRMDVNNKRVIGEGILRWGKYDQPGDRFQTNYKISETSSSEMGNAYSITTI